MKHWISLLKTAVDGVFERRRGQVSDSSGLSWQATFHNDQGICRVVWVLKD